MYKPRNVKFRKNFKLNLKESKEQRSVYPLYGVYGIKVIESGLITEKQMLSCINIIRKILKGKGKYWLMFRLTNQLTSKPNESRMGKGKGNPDIWVSKVKIGKVLFEFELSDKVSDNVKNLVLKRVSERLPLKVELIKIKL